MSMSKSELRDGWETLAHIQIAVVVDWTRSSRGRDVKPLKSEYILKTLQTNLWMD